MAQGEAVADWQDKLPCVPHRKRKFARVAAKVLSYSGSELRVVLKAPPRVSPGVSRDAPSQGDLQGEAYLPNAAPFQFSNCDPQGSYSVSVGAGEFTASPAEAPCLYVQAAPLLSLYWMLSQP